MVYAQQVVCLHVGIAHEGGAHSGGLHDGHGEQGVEVFLATAGVALVLEQRVAGAGCELALLGYLAGAELMAGGGESVAVVVVHHALGSEVILDIVDEPLLAHLLLQGSAPDALGDGTRLIVGHTVHIAKDVAEGQFHDFHAVALAYELRVAYHTLQTEGGHAAVGEHEGPRVGHHLAHPQQVRQLVEVGQVHTHIGLQPDGAAVGGEVDALVAVLHDDHQLAVAFQLGYAPVHAQEEVYPVHILLYLGIDLAGHHKLLIVAGVDGGQHLYLRGGLRQLGLCGLEGGGGGGILSLRGHVFGIACTAGALPEVGVGEASHDGAHHQFLVHCFFFHL